MSKKVAVLLASYNGKKYIKEQIDSALNQKDVVVNIFISDDLSSDGTIEYLQDIYKNDDRLIYLPSENKFGGAAKNFYRLIKDVTFSGYDYVSLSDQDDVWNEDKIIYSIEKMRKEGCDAFSSNVLAFWDNGKEILVDKAQKQCKYDYLFEAAGPGCTYVFSQNVAKDIKRFMIENWESINQINLHDWLIYAYSRESGYRWHIDRETTMSYRQHHLNQVGANEGMKAKIRRFKLIFSSWYRNEVKKIIDVLGIGDKYSFSKLIINKNYFNNILLIRHIFKFRRKFSDRVFFVILLLFGVF